MVLVRFLRCLLCCYEEEENRALHRYQTIPDLVQTPNNYEVQRRYTAPSPPYIPTRSAYVSNLPQSSAPTSSYTNVASTKTISSPVQYFGDLKNVASPIQKKNQTSFTEPKGKSPEPVKKAVQKPQVVNEENPLIPSFKPVHLTPIEACSSSSSQNTPTNSNYVSGPKATTPLYSVPEEFKELFKKDVVPHVLRRHVTLANYKNFFEALMYAEDYYYEKWSEYLLKDVKLELHERAIYTKPRTGTNTTGNRMNKNMNGNGMKDKVFVAFQIDSIPKRRPFLLSRDYVNLRPSGKGKEVEPFQGVLYKVKHGNLVLAEFGDDFYLQHSSSRQYDVSFSFNRVCLKRSHQALSATTDTLLHNLLFPSQTPRVNMLDPPIFTPYLRNLDKNQLSAVENILRLRSSPPFLVDGPPFVFVNKENVMERSATYFVIQEAVQQIYRSSPGSRILINAPRNIICDWLMRSLMVEIPESDIFRGNAAFREKDEVGDDILPLCPFEGECFTCPPLKELQEFRVVLTTYMSSFRLHNQGIITGHFSHIFLVDASSIMEPEMIVSLSNLANQKTVVVVTGASGNCSHWVRSYIGRQYGLTVSYFERLMKRQPYCSLDPLFVARIRDKRTI
ncbi:RNA helicase [Ranunculus cassubicifolius]